MSMENRAEKDGAVPAPKTFLENVDLVFKVVVGVGTLFVALLAFNLNSSVSKTNESIAQVTRELEQQKYAYDEIRDAYDRVDNYLALKEPAPRRGDAILLFLERMSDQNVSGALLGLLQTQSPDIQVRESATGVLASRASIPSAGEGAFDNYRSGFVISEGDRERTDLTVYVCSNAENLDQTVAAANALGGQLSKSSFGKITGSLWAGYDDFVPSTGTITAIFDAGHPEANELDVIDAILQELGLGSLSREPNSGSFTRWSISLIVCF